MRILPLAALLLIAACNKSAPAAGGAQAADTKPAGPVVPASAGNGAEASAGLSVTGKVLETMDSGGYTYLRIKPASGEERWAAVSAAKINKGDEVTVAGAMVMPQFESPTLKRKFENILFGSLAAAPAAGAAAPAQAPAELQKDSVATATAAHGSRSNTAVAIDKPIAKAEGADGRTVAELFAQKKALVGKTVLVRGKVAKVNANILGRNWVHLQDGTGVEKDGTHDVVVATNSTAKVGDVVLAKGTLVADKDVSGVYHFEVLLEDATLVEK